MRSLRRFCQRPVDFGAEIEDIERLTDNIEGTGVRRFVGQLAGI